MKVLMILNDAPYGSEKVYNALGLAMMFQKEHVEYLIRIFLMADAVIAVLPNQSTPEGFYNVERMFKAVLNKGGEVKMCKTCAEARGIKEIRLLEGAQIGTMSELAQWVIESDKVLTF